LEDGLWLGLDDGFWLGLGDGSWLGLEDGFWLGLEDGFRLGLEAGLWLGLEDGLLSVRSVPGGPSPTIESVLARRASQYFMVSLPPVLRSRLL
jgi:hypothetical protein